MLASVWRSNESDAATATSRIRRRLSMIASQPASSSHSGLHCRRAAKDFHPTPAAISSRSGSVLYECSPGASRSRGHAPEILRRSSCATRPYGAAGDLNPRLVELVGRCLQKPPSGVAAIVRACRARAIARRREHRRRRSRRRQPVHCGGGRCASRVAGVAAAAAAAPCDAQPPRREGRSDSPSRCRGQRFTAGARKYWRFRPTARRSLRTDIAFTSGRWTARATVPSTRKARRRRTADVRSRAARSVLCPHRVRREAITLAGGAPSTLFSVPALAA